MIPAVPILDPGFQPLRPGRGAGDDFKIALERESGAVSVFSARLVQDDAEMRRRHAERLAKFFLWSRGGWRLHVWSEDGGVASALGSAYRAGGARAFDADLMSRVYRRKFEVIPATSPAEVPSAVESERVLGGNLDGCRIGFDLGASDYKVAAVRDGEAVYSDEFPWNPKDEADPDYHYRHLNEGLRRAAEHLPRVDAIGGSSAGVIVDNRFMVASLLRSIPEDKLPQARDLFLRLREEWGVPFEVANDGDVTALAGAMSLGVTGLLGIAMGSSEAAGYINPAGKMTGWLNELAFAPVDLNPEAAVDEWSGDRGVGALYFSQQAVNKLLPAAGIPVAAEQTELSRAARSSWPLTSMMTLCSSSSQSSPRQTQAGWQRAQRRCSTISIARRKGTFAKNKNLIGSMRLKARWPRHPAAPVGTSQGPACRGSGARP